MYCVYFAREFLVWLGISTVGLVVRVQWEHGVMFGGLSALGVI